MTVKTICDKCGTEIEDRPGNSNHVVITVQYLLITDAETSDHVKVMRDFHRGCLKNSRAVAGLEGFDA